MLKVRAHLDLTVSLQFSLVEQVVIGASVARQLSHFQPLNLYLEAISIYEDGRF